MHPDQRNPRIVFDFSKAQWCEFGYENQYGHTSPTLPYGPTIRGCRFKEDAVMFGGTETHLDYAKRQGILDTWRLKIKLTFASNHRLTFYGEKAVSVWSEWSAKQFGGKKTKKGK